MKDIAQKRGRPLKDNKNLSTNIIINAAKSMMIENGKIPSIRAIATQLKVDPMALYYYFNNKNALLESITTSIMSDIQVPDDNEKWQQGLLILCKSYLQTLNQFEGLLQILLSMESNNPAKVFINKFKFIIKSLNLNPKIEQDFLNILVDYLHGFSIAMSCDKKNTLTINQIEKPLELLYGAIDLKIGQK
ncbi:TetR/AcrR family transcriptional regulator [Pseudoalteromonas sp. C2R02]|uniref:TetR/AcrR family transcriptional regulator n=1 Tax=Pseudoalteromonas sp. C2R02 TaxID=2841565 RepID=UPI001C092DCE|nr:helix-turn-helix domain-containing protein [Pseudoalteromonas sp. C2R02]MBU2970164.1 TetR/AcrR family transcriptional regulator [Pseudoalteromonas sp. C2R02]